MLIYGNRSEEECIKAVVSFAARNLGGFLEDSFADCVKEKTKLSLNLARSFSYDLGTIRLARSREMEEFDSFMKK